MTNTGISVVIPNYNGRQLLEQILPALYDALQNSGMHNEVIISDDCSTDDSVNFLQNNYSEIKLVLGDQNRGFSPAINKGIFASHYSYILLLNSDVKLLPDYFTNLLRYFEREDTFGVMGRIVGWDDNLIQDAAKFPSFHGAKIKTSGNYYLKVPGENDWLYSMYLSGANAFVNRKKLLELGGFSELFAPFYIEDFELSLRAWRLGWKCYYEHNAICRHRLSVSIKAKNKKDFINIIYNRNKMFLHALHLYGTARFLWFLQLMPEILVRFFTGRWYYFKSFYLFTSNYFKVITERNKLKELAKRKGITLRDVKEVANLIRQDIKGKNIIRF